MSRKILIPLVFVLFFVLLLELSLRVYYFRKSAFSYTLMQSYGLLIDSDNVQRAANTDIYYELKPNLDTWFLGKKLVTNSQGLADDEYSLTKPDNTFRVAVVGSSWTMATSVEYPDAYHSLIEQELAQKLAPKKVEFINFGVENYGLSEIVANVRYKALDYDPDMIIVAMTAMTPLFLWVEEKEPFVQPDSVSAFWQSYLYSAVMNALERPSYYRTVRPQVDALRGGYSRQIRRALDELKELTSGQDVEVVILMLTHKGFNSNDVGYVDGFADQRGFRFVHAHVEDIAAEMGMENERLVAKLYQNHPNETGHWLIAQKLLKELWNTGALQED